MWKQFLLLPQNFRIFQASRYKDKDQILLFVIVVLWNKLPICVCQNFVVPYDNLKR